MYIKRKIEAEIRQLSKEFPIVAISCASCKSIQKKENEWQSIEKFLYEKSDSAKLTHGICDDCLRKNYPNEADFVIGKIA